MPKDFLMTSPMINLSSKTFDILRDTALSYEYKDLHVARELMSLALVVRPAGEFIASKFTEYTRILESESSKETKKFFDRVYSGDFAIIPAGFRCYTKQKLLDHYGIWQTTLPFDYGFFPPSSIVKLLYGQRVTIDFDSPDTFSVCIKREQGCTSEGLPAICFKTSTFEEINHLIKDSSASDLNSYLDATGGYYIHVKAAGFVLAHYVWHPSASHDRSHGITDIKANIDNTCSIINKRISRPMSICKSASKVFFVVDIPVDVTWMVVDDNVHILNELSGMEYAVRDVFGSKADLMLLPSRVDDSAFLESATGEVVRCCFSLVLYR